MNDAEYEEQKVRVERYVDRWLGPLGLHWWRNVDIQYHRDGASFSERGFRHAGALTTVSWEYKEATVEFDLSQIAQWAESDLEYAVLHEFMHILLQQMTTAFTDDDKITGIQGEHVERTATEIAQAFLWVRDFASEGKLGEAGNAARTEPAHA